MNRWIMAVALLLLATAGRAQQNIYDATPSTVTMSNVTISSVTPTRVDNLVLGTTGYVIPNRTYIKITIPKNSAAIDCDFFVGSSTSANQVSLSTQAASANLGAQYATTSTQSLQDRVPLPTNLGMWCQAEGTPPVIHVQQFSPFKPGTRTIPGT